MKYGNYSLLFNDPSFRDKENAYANLGDNIIALAIDYIYETIGISKDQIVYINKDGTKDYDGEYTILLATINLWDSSLEARLPMSPKIYPIFLSVVANRDVFLDRPDLIDYFKKYSPIGCRDEQTLSIFRKYGIEGYLTGCHTMCFPKRRNEPTEGKVFLVDISDDLEAHIPEHIREKSEYISHAVPYQEYPVTLEENERLNNLAQNLLDRYANEAELVVTGRLHVAAPCIAMGIPVIFAANTIDFRFGWLDKFIKLYSLEEYSKIDWSPKHVELEQTKKLLINFIDSALKQAVKLRGHLFALSEFYEDRQKTIFYANFRTKINLLKKKYSQNDSFKYIIWGAGQHCYYAFGLINELFPNATLQAIVDKYQEGKKLRVNIIKAGELDSIDFDHVFITTTPGKDEALNAIESRFGKDASECYTLILSQHKS